MAKWLSTRVLTLLSEERTSFTDRARPTYQRPTYQRLNLNPYLISHGNINSKWIKELTTRTTVIKVLEENIKEKLHDIGFGNGS